jgi:hypothetical protein
MIYGLKVGISRCTDEIKAEKNRKRSGKGMKMFE